jgi:secretion/DNA translocation related TadE-like protein
MLMIGMLTVVLSLAWAAVIIAGYLVAEHRARSVADLAALSGASAVQRGDQPGEIGGDQGCAVARRMAERQGATARCSHVGDAIDFVVTVTATVPVPVTFPGLPGEVSATGHAGPTGTATSPR